MCNTEQCRGHEAGACWSVLSHASYVRRRCSQVCVSCKFILTVCRVAFYTGCPLLWISWNVTESWGKCWVKSVHVLWCIVWLTDWLVYSDATNVHPHWIKQIRNKTPEKYRHAKHVLKKLNYTKQTSVKKWSLVNIILTPRQNKTKKIALLYCYLHSKGGYVKGSVSLLVCDISDCFWTFVHILDTLNIILWCVLVADYFCHDLHWKRCRYWCFFSGLLSSWLTTNV